MNIVLYTFCKTNKCTVNIGIECSLNLLLTSVSNVEVNCDNMNQYQSKCTYTCDEGYRVQVGQSRVRVCSYQGTWLGSTPTCIGK